MWNEIKQQHKQDLTHIQSRLPDFLTIHLVWIDPLQCNVYKDHHIIHGSSTQLNPIEIHAVVDINSFPPSLYKKMDSCTHRLSFLDLNSLDFVFLQCDGYKNGAKVQLGKSVSIFQAHPNQRGYIDATGNIPARRYREPGEGLAILFNKHTSTHLLTWIIWILTSPQAFAWPDLSMNGITTSKTGVAVEQPSGEITLYQGGYLLHTNSITDHLNQDKLCAQAYHVP
ncbi:hypothetical protein FN846DRAFT_891343 [Sphaerosporella brunnea]|uniref:Uncharacterized protein n=1 Tax=Sphaerosporella brunnea TaxID=1250544 RepID=A0A5J5ETR0_9PEZI|nr:hypothetical protein FN846DRAFT_891343 [Sphaerosporella brunnea]